VRVHAPRPRRGGCFTISIRIIRAASIRAYLWCVYQPFSLSHRRRHFNHIRCSHPRYVEIFCCASVNVGQCRDHPSIKRRRRFSHVLSLCWVAHSPPDTPRTAVANGLSDRQLEHTWSLALWWVFRSRSSITDEIGRKQLYYMQIRFLVTMSKILIMIIYFLTAEFFTRFAASFYFECSLVGCLCIYKSIR